MTRNALAMWMSSDKLTEYSQYSVCSKRAHWADLLEMLEPMFLQSVSDSSLRVDISGTLTVSRTAAAQLLDLQHPCVICELEEDDEEPF